MSFIASVFSFLVLIVMSVQVHAVTLSSHRAVYDIKMVSAKTGSQVMDVRGKMMFTLKKSCDGWISDHKFDVDYEYTGSNPMQIQSKFTSFEKFDGQQLRFSSTRLANGEKDQVLRGLAKIGGQASKQAKQNFAEYSVPESLHFDLEPRTLFPVQHTISLLESAQAGKKIVNATVFDGTDEFGPVEVNAVIGKKIETPSAPKNTHELLKHSGWAMQMAVFPIGGDETNPLSDYEMSLTLLENGVIQDMIVDYHSFVVSQTLVAVEPVADDNCGVE
jgi:hypothetical protein